MLIVIRLDNRGQNNTCPIKTIFGLPAEAFDILKSPFNIVNK